MVVVAEEIEETAAARLRASSISSLSSSLTSILLAFLLSIFQKLVLGCSSTTFYTNLFSGIWAPIFGPIPINGENWPTYGPKWANFLGKLIYLLH